MPRFLDIDGGTPVAAAADVRAAIDAGRNFYVNVKDYGAECDGATDDTAAWASAVAAVEAAGGGLICFDGTSVVTQIELASKVGILGRGKGKSIIQQSTSRADGEHCILLDGTTAVHVQLAHFQVFGDADNQTAGTYSDGIHMKNSSDGGRYYLNNLYIRGTSGNGLYFGFGQRASVIDGVDVYKANLYGISLATFSDSVMVNCDVGQSGDSGFYFNGGSNSRFSNLKSWYSGRLVSGAPGFYQRNGNTNQFTGLSSQENSGEAFEIWGQSQSVTGQTIEFVSDSDNTSGGSLAALKLSNASNNIIRYTVAINAPLATQVAYGMQVDSSSTDNKITMRYNPSAVSSYPCFGAGLQYNELDLCRSSVAETPTGTYAPNVFLNREAILTLTANRTISNPSTQTSSPPVGLTYRFVLIQDGTGSRTITWGNAYKIPAGTSFDTTASTKTVIEFSCIGNANWVMTNFATAIPA